MIENYSYSPTLYTRSAEIKALQNLPAATKDRIFPILLGRPWPNARELSRAWEKINEAFGGRPYALDLDPYKYQSGGRHQAAADFDELFDPANGHEKYYSALEEIDRAIPTIQIRNGQIADLGQQLDHAQRLDRGLLLRIKNGQVDQPAIIADQVLSQSADCIVAIDCGWSANLIAQEMWASDIVGAISRDRPETEIIVTGSSFPNSFVNNGPRASINLIERLLYDNLVRQHNAARLTYGDWGSTRPPSDPVPMRNIPRIDLPTTGSWICFRRDKNYDPNETYGEIAQRVVADQDWPHGLNIWGTYTISNTANGLLGAIRSPSAATAARVNMHIHRQAHFGSNVEISDVDEPFED